MDEIRILIFTDKFVGEKEPSLQSRLFGEYLMFSKKIKLVIISGNIQAENYENIQIFKSSCLKFPFFQSFFQTLGFLFTATKLRNNYDLIFSRMLDPKHLFPAIVISLLFKKKIISWFSDAKYIRKGGLGKKIIQMGLNNSSYFGCPYESQIAEIEDLGIKIDKDKIFHINPGVNLSKFKPEFKNNLENIILNACRINPVKGIEDSIKVMPYLKEKFPDLKLKIVGPITNESYFKYLKNLVSKLDCKNLVEFVGPVPNNKMNSIYNSSKLFLFTSKHEGQPGVILEAMACGLPVISTPVGIVPKLIKDDINGFVIKRQDPKTITSKLFHFLTNENLRKKVALTARETVEKDYSLENYTNNLIHYFKKMVSE